jgi:hypothetical protein
MRRSGKVAHLIGKRNGVGYAFLVPEPGLEPCFFRDPDTSEPCLMIGMHALKKVPLAIVSNAGAKLIL